jgi:hypothetical protein
MIIVQNNCKILLHPIPNYDSATVDGRKFILGHKQGLVF